VTAEFAQIAQGYRTELLAHCYRMLGSIHDAEDVVQETYVRAWRGFDRFEGRSSLRRWLYTIATRACLTALDSGKRRPLPSGLGAPSDDHRVAVPAARSDIAWLQPLPDVLLDGGGADPASVVAAHSGIRLALVATLQYLPARQRAALILCDVLSFSAAESASMMGMTTAAVNSALQRARAQLKELGLRTDDIAEPVGVDARDLVDRYAAAFERADVHSLINLVRADVELEMPPTEMWFTGQDAVLGFLSTRVVRRAGVWRLTPTRANGQPALVASVRQPNGELEPHGIVVLTVSDGLIARITAFNDPSLVGLIPVADNPAR
jgi:RNA polymerase sigma-70 factor, ECF subfamily